MATHVKTTGEVIGVKPRSGSRFTLEELQAFVGGYIEAVHMPSGALMFVNEEGKLKQLPVNAKATLFASVQGGLQPGDVIVGDALMITVQEAGEYSSED